jgi:hypothetical protein
VRGGEPARHEERGPSPRCPIHVQARRAAALSGAQLPARNARRSWTRQWTTRPPRAFVGAGNRPARTARHSELRDVANTASTSGMRTRPSGGRVGCFCASTLATSILDAPVRDAPRAVAEGTLRRETVIKRAVAPGGR